MLNKLRKPNNLAFRCSICGEEHGDPALFNMAEPAYLAELTPEQREAAVRLKPGRCEMNALNGDGAPIFITSILGELRVPIQNSKQFLTWGLWVVISEESYKRFSRTMDGDQSDMEADGIIWLDQPAYVAPEDRGKVALECLINFGPARQMPRIKLKRSDHLLFQHWKNGISRETAHELIEDTLHPDE